LSVQIIDTAPRVSVAVSVRTIAFCFAIYLAQIANTSVKMAGSHSGIPLTNEARENVRVSKKSNPFNHPNPKFIVAAMIAMVAIALVSHSILYEKFDVHVWTDWS
jgi:Na+/citrate or Na+/malate symporter